MAWQRVGRLLRISVTSKYIIIILYNILINRLWSVNKKPAGRFRCINCDVSKCSRQAIAPRVLSTSPRRGRVIALHCVVCYVLFYAYFCVCGRPVINRVRVWNVCPCRAARQIIDWLSFSVVLLVYLFIDRWFFREFNTQLFMFVRQSNNALSETRINAVSRVWVSHVHMIYNNMMYASSYVL